MSSARIPYGWSIISGLGRQQVEDSQLELQRGHSAKAFLFKLRLKPPGDVHLRGLEKAVEVRP